MSLDDATREQLDQMGRYLFEVSKFGLELQAKAVYCFVVGGVKGTGGSPVVIGLTSQADYLERCRELVRLMRRSADLLERDIGEGGCGRVAPILTRDGA